MGTNAKGETFPPGIVRCSNCRWWARLVPDDEENRASRFGPWPDRNPAGACKRFPPTGQWGATPEARCHGVGVSIRTFHDDFCGEFDPNAEAIRLAKGMK